MIPNDVQATHDAHAIIYARTDCACCRGALEVLHSQGVSVSVVVIDDDPQLVDRYGADAPVVEIDGRVRFRRGVDSTLLARLLRRRK